MRKPAGLNIRLSLWLSGFGLLLIAGCSSDETLPHQKISIVPDTVIELSVATDSGNVRDTITIPLASPDSITLASHHLMIPIPGVRWEDLVDSFHDKRGTRTHNALDIMAPRGTLVLSVDAGTLLKLHNSVPGGLTAYAADPSRRFIYMYGHLDRYNPALREGQALSRGDTIGFVGSTGNAAAAGPHLHFAIVRNTDMKKWWMGTPIDPRPLLR